jgi:general stress protein 26
VWEQDAFWFSSSVGSRKARNVAADPRCVITTEDAMNPDTVEGRATITRDAADIARLLELMNAKYATGYPPEFLDPDVNATIRVEPSWAFGVVAEHDFTGSPTRWTFGAESG